MRLSPDSGIDIDKKSIIRWIGGFFSVVFFLWFLFVFIPDLFHGIFHTFLGNIMLFTVIILTALRSVWFAFVLAVLFYIMFNLSRFNFSNVESFSLFSGFRKRASIDKNRAAYKQTHKLIHKLVDRVVE